jgi:TIR domain
MSRVGWDVRCTLECVESGETYEFDVALSYSGEDRPYVSKVANHLRTNDVRVFYDEFFTSRLWGRDLYTFLDTVYREKSRFTVVFISQNYVAKPWPSHERQSAQARALNELGPYLLPVRFDDSILPGLRPTVAYVDATKVTPEQLAQMILDKLSDVPGSTLPEAVISSVPRTSDEQRELLAQRPFAWEYLLYASVLLERRTAIEEKWRDNEIRYARKTGNVMDDGTAIRYLSAATQQASLISSGITRVLDSDAQTAAFGAPGEPGDPERIEHLATRLIGVYEEFLDWARDLRSITVDAELRQAFELAARLADRPARQIREFVDSFVASVEKFSGQIQGNETIVIRMTLTLDIDQDVLSACMKELSRAERKIRRKSH